MQPGVVKARVVEEVFQKSRPRLPGLMMLPELRLSSCKALSPPYPGTTHIIVQIIEYGNRKRSKSTGAGVADDRGWDKEVDYRFGLSRKTPWRKSAARKMM